MKNLNDAGITLNRLMSQAKTPQQRYRVKQYRAIYMERLKQSNKITGKDWVRMIVLYFLGLTAIFTILRLVDNGLIF